MINKKLVCYILGLLFLVGLLGMAGRELFMPKSDVAVVTVPETVQVVFLLADSPTDCGWNAAHYRGIEALRALGEVVAESNLSFTVKLDDGRLLDVMVVEKVGYSEADIGRVTRSVLEQDPLMVFGVYWDAQGPISTIAEERKDVLFEHCSGYPFITSNEDNLSTYFIRQEEGDYAVGYLVGLMGQARVGLVGTFSIPEPVRGVNGFALGLQRGLEEAGLNPADAEVRVVWINSWLDGPKEQLAAQGLMDAGYDVIRQMADTPYSSQAACQEKDILTVGYGTDVTPYADCALVSNVWDWGPYYVERVQAALDGTWQPIDWWSGFDADAIKLVGWNNDLVPTEMRQKTESLVADIKAGFNPFCGPIYGTGINVDDEVVNIVVPAGKCLSDMDLLTMQWYVDGVEGEYPASPPDGFGLELVDIK